MAKIAISVENLSKTYQLGQINTGTFSRDLDLWWARMRGKPNPLLKIGQEDHGNRAGETLWALKDVSFSVEQGEVLGIIGKNGAGKSTLLKILSRVTAPTSGMVKVKGRIASLLEVGTGFHPELTGRENIYLNGAILGMTRQEISRKFDEIVAFAEIEKFIDTPVKRYSSGMYVRLAFAVAANLESEILLVDEVLAVGDAEFQKKCLGKMGDVSSREGRTVLFVSHNMGAVGSLCKIGALLKQGNIVNIGPVEEVIQNYLNSQTDLRYTESSRHKQGCTLRISITNILLDPPISFNDPLEIIVDYEINERTDKFAVEWFIKDIFGQRIMSGLSASSEGTWFRPRGIKGTIRSTLSHWRLPGGQYSLSVILCNPGIECMDYIENAVVFKIGDLSPKGTKFIFTTRHGLFLPEIEWECDKLTSKEVN